MIYRSIIGDAARQIEPQALQLPPKGRTRLAQRFVASSAPESDGDAEQAWIEEAQRRPGKLPLMGVGVRDSHAVAIAGPHRRGGAR